MPTPTIVLCIICIPVFYLVMDQEWHRAGGHWEEASQGNFKIIYKSKFFGVYYPKRCLFKAFSFLNPNFFCSAAYINKYFQKFIWPFRAEGGGIWPERKLKRKSEKGEIVNQKDENISGFIINFPLNAKIVLLLVFIFLKEGNFQQEGDGLRKRNSWNICLCVYIQRKYKLSVQI